MSLSGNSYKARLGLALMGLAYELIEVDWRKGETRTEAFLRLNPRGQVPVLEDGELIVWESQAILVYLARQYDPRWLPMEVTRLTQVVQWLGVSENEIYSGLAIARGAKRYDMEVDMAEAMRWSLRALATVILSSSESSSIPRMAMMSWRSLYLCSTCWTPRAT